MNAQLSHCINKCLSAAALMLCIQTAFAQTPTFRPFDKFVNANFWNAGRNVTGIRQDTVTVSFAEAYASYTKNNFRDYSDPTDQWNEGAMAKTFKHLERISMTGSFSFDQTRGRNMTGSMFIHPGYYPIDAQEFTPGTKITQTYDFSGGLAADLTDHWIIGGKMDFESANQAKRKDLRYTDYRLDLTVAPSVQYHFGVHSIGLTYIYRKTSENTDAEQIGTAKATSYYAFLDKGLMSGVYQVWDGSGTHLAESGVNGLPVKEISNGGAIQYSDGKLYVDFEYLYNDGTVGEKQFIWFRFPGESMNCNIGYKFRSARALNLLQITGNDMYQYNRENVIVRITDNGITNAEKEGQNTILHRTRHTLSASYDRYSSVWDLHVGGTGRQSYYQMYSSYPYYQNVTLRQYSFDVSGMFHPGAWDLGVCASGFCGNVDDSGLQVSDQTIKVSSVNLATSSWKDRWYDYATFKRASGAAVVRYNFSGHQKWVDGLYVEGDARYLKALEGAKDANFQGFFRIGYRF
jgi:hypothetical protein